MVVLSWETKASWIEKRKTAHMTGTDLSGIKIGIVMMQRDYKYGYTNTEWSEGVVENLGNEKLIFGDPWKARGEEKWDRYWWDTMILLSIWIMEKFNYAWVIAIVGSSYCLCRWEGKCLQTGTSPGREKKLVFQPHLRRNFWALLSSDTF